MKEMSLQTLWSFQREETIFNYTDGSANLANVLSTIQVPQAEISSRTYFSILGIRRIPSLLYVKGTPHLQAQTTPVRYLCGDYVRPRLHPLATINKCNFMNESLIYISAQKNTEYSQQTLHEKVFHPLAVNMTYGFELPAFQIYFYFWKQISSSKYPQWSKQFETSASYFHKYSACILNMERLAS